MISRVCLPIYACGEVKIWVIDKSCVGSCEKLRNYDEVSCRQLPENDLYRHRVSGWKPQTTTCKRFAPVSGLLHHAWSQTNELLTGS